MTRRVTRLKEGAERAVVRVRVRIGEARGQTTTEYALVILAAAAIAVALISWARSTGKLPAFFDQIIDRIVGEDGR